jgi:hypothetical protein
MGRLITGLLAAALSFAASAPARGEGDPPGHACWDLGDEKAVDCYRAYAIWAAQGADEALVPFLHHLRTERRAEALGGERDLVAAAIDVHRLAQLDAEADCALSVAAQGLEGSRALWVRDACRMELRHDRTRQLRGDLAESSDETSVAYAPVWPDAESSKDCPTDLMEAWAACEAERRTIAEARLAAAFAELGDAEAERAFTAYAAAECGLLRDLTRAASRQTKTLTYAPCMAAAAEGRLAWLTTLIELRDAGR